MKEKLDTILSPLGQEQSFTRALCEEFRSLGFDATLDALGNMIATQKNSPPKAKTVMISAPCDQIGCMVHDISSSGMLWISALADFEVQKYAYNTVKFPNGVKGVFVPKQDKLADKPSISDFQIDIGAKSAKEAKKRIAIGDCCAFTPPAFPLTRSQQCGTDRTGVTFLLDLAKELTASPYRLVFVCTVQSRLNARGAKIAAFAVQPDYSISLAQTAKEIGSGIVLRRKDRTAIADVTLCDCIRQTAKQHSISFSEEVENQENGELASIQSSCSARCAVLAIPTRYAKSPTSICDKHDLASAKALLCALLQEESLGQIPAERLE